MPASNPMVPSTIRRLCLRGAALTVLAMLLAMCASPASVEEGAFSTVRRDVAATESAIVSWADREASYVSGDAEDKLPNPLNLPPLLLLVTDHAHPTLGTDGSLDIPNAAKTHDAELDREAAEGMIVPGPRAGPTEGQEHAAIDMDQSIAAARARLGTSRPRPQDPPDGGAPVP